MGIFDSLRNFGSSIWGGLKNGFNKVIGIGNTVRNGIRRGWDFVKNIPVIGNIAKNAANTTLPLIGQSLGQLGQKASDALDTANEVNRYVNPGG